MEITTSITWIVMVLIATLWQYPSRAIHQRYTKQFVMSCPDVYSGEMMWDMLKSEICNASEEHGYTLRSIQGDKSTVLTKSAKYGIPVSGWKKPPNNAFIFEVSWK
jgi:hypothetical protein